jgi:D-alanyl-D-alanine carboxypeptidase
VSKTGRNLAAVAVLLVVVFGSAACAPQQSSFGASPQQSGTPSSTASTAPSTTASAKPGSTPVSTPSATKTPAATTGFNKHQKSINDPKSYWVVVNKLRPLKPKTYSPSDIINVPVAHDNPPRMRKTAGDQLVKMFKAAKKAGAGSMQIQSAWRPYQTQVSVYAGWVARLGKKQADRQSARPGYSEHQTGLAVDISPVPLKCALAACFGKTPQGKWLAANAWKYGYLLRYPSDKEKVTGYEYEPWHFRFIGNTLAAELHKVHVKTLEEFFGLSAAPNYAN